MQKRKTLLLHCCNCWWRSNIVTHFIPRDANVFQSSLESLNVFEGWKQIVDYHGMYDTKYFVVSMVKLLLKALDDREIHNAVIVMDNAKYHKHMYKGSKNIFLNNLLVYTIRTVLYFSLYLVLQTIQGRIHRAIVLSVKKLTTWIKLSVKLNCATLNYW